MGYVKDSVTRVSLPSDNNYWIDLKTVLNYGEIKEIAPGETPGIEVSDKYLNIAIKAWNLDDDKGVVLEITPDNINLLQQDDIVALTNTLNKEAGSATEKKPL